MLPSSWPMEECEVLTVPFLLLGAPTPFFISKRFQKAQLCFSMAFCWSSFLLKNSVNACLYGEKIEYDISLYLSPYQEFSFSHPSCCEDTNSRSFVSIPVKLLHALLVPMPLRGISLTTTLPLTLWTDWKMPRVSLRSLRSLRSPSL